MGIEVKVIADSISNNIRLTTLQVRFHRFCLPEFNTHRMFSRNFSSSRAIPVAKMIEQVETDPAMPVYWGKNKAGMQAIEECIADVEHPNGALSSYQYAWQTAAIQYSEWANSFSKAGYHKQITNRLIEPFQWVNGVVTSTEWDNFFALRDHPAAQPEIQELARKMKQAMNESEPVELEEGEWHLPYITEDDWIICSEFMDLNESIQILQKCSAARCARASYNKHDGTSPSIEDDLELYNQLVTRPYADKRGFVYGDNDPIHASPCEHQATPMAFAINANKDIPPKFWEKGITHQDRENRFWSANFKGWIQARQLL